MKKMLETGKVVNIHGLKGEIKVIPWCDAPEFICEFDVLYIGKEQKTFEVESARVHKGMALIKLKGIDTPEAANSLRNSVVYIDREDIELDEGTYFIQDLIGLTVKDVDTDKVYGEVTDVLQTGANDVYEIKNDKKTYLVPAIEQVVIDTDIENSVMLIRPLEGLFDED